MGGAVSTGRDNDDLIDNLLHADYIRTSSVERVFRAVNRADYFLPEARANAYKDVAWKSGLLHLSAPCIYSEVMEGLCLSGGLSFLNLGSGTGYLSTMAGLILGSNGVNHGVEIHAEVIQYANKKLDDFKKYSGAIDEFNFCEPKFIQGNCLCLATDRQYDRVYCGAACPQQYENCMKNLIRVGGILVMPINDQLMQIKRTSPVTWEDRSLLPVSFATLIQPTEQKQEIVELLDVVPLSLQALTRSVIRTILRKNVELENPNLRKRKKPKRKRRQLRRWLVEPIYDISGEDPFSSDDEHYHPGQRPGNNRRRATQNVFGTVMDHLGYTSRHNRGRPDQDGRQNPCLPSTDDSDPAASGSSADINEARAIITRRSTAKQTTTAAARELEEHNRRRDRALDEAAAAVEGVFANILEEIRRTETPELEHSEDQELEIAFENVFQNRPQQNDVEEPDDNNDSAEESSNKKREKFDSGIGEEIGANARDSENDTMDVDSSSSSDTDELGHKRNSRTIPENRTSKWRKIYLPAHRLHLYSSDSETIAATDEPKFVQNYYTCLMREKIEQLPLPPILKNYLNFYRDFK